VIIAIQAKSSDARRIPHLFLSSLLLQRSNDLLAWKEGSRRRRVVNFGNIGIDFEAGRRARGGRLIPDGLPENRTIWGRRGVIVSRGRNNRLMVVIGRGGERPFLGLEKTLDTKTLGTESRLTGSGEDSLLLLKRQWYDRQHSKHDSNSTHDDPFCLPSPISSSDISESMGPPLIAALAGTSSHPPRVH
jgi:hypothetical protein